MKTAFDRDQLAAQMMPTAVEFGKAVPVDYERELLGLSVTEYDWKKHRFQVAAKLAYMMADALIQEGMKGQRAEEDREAQLPPPVPEEIKRVAMKRKGLVRERDLISDWPDDIWLGGSWGEGGEIIYKLYGTNPMLPEVPELQLIPFVNPREW